MTRSISADIPEGIYKILKERMEQINKHGYSLEKDYELNDWVDLRSAALYAITLDGHFYPTHWEPWFADKCKDKTLEERIIVAGALLSASLDLMYFAEQKEDF